MDYEIRRGFHGVQARSTVKIGGKRELRIDTFKASQGGLVCFAQVVEVGDDGTVSFVVFQDLSARLATAKARATEKAIIACHLEGTANVGSLKGRIESQYPGCTLPA
jgi:hypothetical protein